MINENKLWESSDATFKIDKGEHYLFWANYDSFHYKQKQSYSPSTEDEFKDVRADVATLSATSLHR